MKKKNKKTTPRKKKEFRYYSINVLDGNKNLKIRHPAYIFLKKGNVLTFVSITHSSKIKNKIVVKLRKNPNPKDFRDLYWIKEIKYDTIDRFSKRNNGWKMNDLDDQDIREEHKKR